METEIEAKFLNVNHELMRKRLLAAGAECVQPMTEMRRQNYHVPSAGCRSWARVRDEGGKMTMSLKSLQDRTLHGTKEVCLTVDDFGKADSFLCGLGLEKGGYQETRRESWRLGDVEIELDEWPWVKTFMEIEGPNGKAVREMAEKLGLNWENATHGSVEIAYRAEYDITDEDINILPEIKFSASVPKHLAAKRKEPK
jgi:adenylate cyclase, class 2